MLAHRELSFGQISIRRHLQELEAPGLIAPLKPESVSEGGGTFAVAVHQPYARLTVFSKRL
jgi:hypothetical protein